MALSTATRLVLAAAVVAVGYYLWQRQQGSYTTPLPATALPPTGAPIIDALGGLYGANW